MIKIRKKNGQILVIFPFIVIFLTGLILLMIDVSAMVEERIHIQTTADIAARDGALWQGYFLDQISSMNAPLVYCYYVMTAQCICRWWPARKTKYCAGWRAVNKTAKALIKAQDALSASMSTVVRRIVKKSAEDNGASSVSVSGELSLFLKRTFAVSPGYDVGMNIGCYDVVRKGKPAGFLLRKDIRMPTGTIGSCHIKERVDVTVVKRGKRAYGSAILGRGLEFPNMTAVSSARPYWMGNLFGDHDPRKDDLRGMDETYGCMFQGRWDAKLVKYKKR